MINSKYLWSLDVLQYPGRYYERHLQEAIENLWDVLFGDYQLVKVKMSSSWRPDIVAGNYEEKTVLIIELKGDPPSGNKKQAIAQVSGYGLRALENASDARIKLMVIGPWEGGGVAKSDKFGGGYILFINIQDLGKQVAKLFERMVCWCLNTPFPSLHPQPLLDDPLKSLEPISPKKTEQGMGEPGQYDEEELEGWSKEGIEKEFFCKETDHNRQVPSPAPELEAESR